MALSVVSFGRVAAALPADPCLDCPLYSVMPASDARWRCPPCAVCGPLTSQDEACGPQASNPAAAAGGSKPQSAYPKPDTSNVILDGPITRKKLRNHGRRRSELPATGAGTPLRQERPEYP
jgi:hypothetical protein